MLLLDNQNTEEFTTFRQGQLIPPPLPILPKQLPDYEPPKCPLDHITFIQLKKFQNFGETKPDQLGIDFNKYQMKKRKKDPDDHEYGESPTAQNYNVSLPQSAAQPSPSKIVAQQQPANQPLPTQGETDDIPTFVNNIVFCRDKKQLAKIDEQNKFSSANPGFYNLRHLIQHENYLNIKTLIKNCTLQSEMERYESLNRLQNKNKKKPGANGAPRIGTDTEAFIAQLADGSSEKTLIFESRFESGNLFLAQKGAENEYNLLMQNDINTQGHTQWFYFRVQNGRKGQQYKFNIINYSKPDSLFNYGMKVAIYSEQKAENQKISWYRGGNNISYFANSIRKEPLYMGKSYYTLTFTYEFEYDNDAVHFAYAVPYTYTDLLDDIVAIEMDPLRSPLVSRKTLCKTLAGVNCDYLTITSREKKEGATQRKCVIISARVHPGETVGSWMMRGVIKFITDPHNIEAKLLRENFIFKIIPMLNPDGVINGNYRCSLAGCDLNRRWKTPSKVIHPTIYSTKQLVKESHEERGLQFFCDLHGHSRKHNVFMYGCHNQKVPEETRIFPYLLSKFSQYFSFDYSRFGVQKSKEATARVALFKELKDVANIFTMESTFSGMDCGPMKGNHLSTDDLEKMGRDLMRGLGVYCELHLPSDMPNVSLVLTQKNSGPNDLDKKTFKEDLTIGNGKLKALLAEELKSNGQLLKNDGDSSSGSESAPSDDNLQPEEIIKMIPVIDKKTKKDLEQKKLKIQQQQQLAIQQQKDKLLKEQQQQQALLSAKKPIKKSVSRSNLNGEKRTKMEKVKLPNIDLDKKEEEKKKPKPEMIDAWTQTDRSDYAMIKSRLKSLNRDGLIPLPGSLQSIMQKQSALDQHPALRLKSHRPHQLNTLTRTPGGYSSTPGNQLSNLTDSKLSNDFVSSLLQKQQSVTNQPSNLDPFGTSGIGSSASKYSNQLSNYANSDTNLKSLRSPTHQLGSSNNGSFLLSGSSNYRDLTHRTNVASRIQPINDQFFQPNVLQTPQSLYKGNHSQGGGSGVTAIQSIVDQNKYNSLSSSLSSGQNQGLSPNIKRQVAPYTGQSSLFKSNRNELISNNNIGGGNTLQQTIPTVVGSIQQEQANIKKLISGVQMNFKNGQSELTRSLLAEMQSPGRTPAQGFQSHSMQPMGGSGNKNNLIHLRSPNGAVPGALQNQNSSSTRGVIQQQQQQQPQSQSELMFPSLKNKYNSGGGNTSAEIILQGPSNLGAALQQLLGHDSSISPFKPQYSSSQQSQHNTSTSPLKKGATVIKNSNVNFVGGNNNINQPAFVIVASNQEQQQAKNSNNISSSSNSQLQNSNNKRNQSQQRQLQIAGQQSNIQASQAPQQKGGNSLLMAQISPGKQGAITKRDSQKNILL